jgi:hypothetical protein
MDGRAASMTAPWLAGRIILTGRKRQKPDQDNSADMCRKTITNPIKRQDEEFEIPKSIIFATAYMSCSVFLLA